MGKKDILKLTTVGREDILKLITGTENVHINNNNNIIIIMGLK
jgi:hypothetical protein